MSDYPAGIDSFRENENVAGIEYNPAQTRAFYAEDLNEVRAAVVAIEETVGENPSGPYVDVVTRLNDSDDAAAITAGTANSAYAARVPVGAGNIFFGSTAPTGWLICDGAAVSRTTYSALWSLLGTTYGAGNGSTTFNLPDLRQRFPMGVAASGTGNALAATGGAIDHRHDFRIALWDYNWMASGADAGFQDAGAYKYSTSSYASRTGGDGSASRTGATASVSVYGMNRIYSVGDTSTNNPPFIAINYIIKT
jgi:microcystin-dependent protein